MALPSKPEMYLSNDGGAVLRVFTPLAAAIKLTPSIILLEIEFLIRNDAAAIYENGAWWLEISTRKLRKRIGKCMSVDTINRSITQLKEQGLLNVQAGKNPSDPQKISLNVEGINKLKCVFVKVDNAENSVHEAPKKDSVRRLRALHKARKQTQNSSENTENEPVRKSDTGSRDLSENRTPPVRKPDTENGKSPQNRTRPVRKSDSIEVLEDLNTEDKENLSLERESDERAIDPQFAAAMRAFNKIRRGTWTAQESELMKSDLEEFGFERVMWAIKQAEGRTPASWRYCHTILLQQTPSPSSAAPPPPDAADKQEADDPYAFLNHLPPDMKQKAIESGKTFGERLNAEHKPKSA